MQARTARTAHQLSRLLEGECLHGQVLKCACGGCDEDILQQAGAELSDDELQPRRRALWDVELLLRAGVDDDTEQECLGDGEY